MDLLCSVEAALRVGPRAAGRWLLGGDLENLRCVTALATVGLPWLLVCLWQKRKQHTSTMLQQRQAEDAVDRTDEMNRRSLESISQGESMARDCLLRHEASERLSWGMREQVRADEAEARVTELTAQLDRQENIMAKDGALHKSSSAAANGAVPMHVPVRRVDTARQLFHLVATLVRAHPGTLVVVERLEQAMGIRCGKHPPRAVGRRLPSEPQLKHLRRVLEAQHQQRGKRA